MTATAFANNPYNIAQRAAATHRLAELAHYVFGEGFLPDVAAIASGYKNREAAYRAAKNAGRPALAAALTLPTPAQQRAYRIEDVEFLLDAGESAERTAARAGFASLEVAIVALRRWGRADLADRLQDSAPADEWGDVDEWDAA